ncbi:MAG TPA: AGE family epimerase/isomerase, partial [Terriglobia bacterium]|nr:AGE family epimerase/isomerase [Terriglobia bacterium]
SKLEKISPEELQAKFEAARPALYAAREKRIHPGRDEKILTDWNGLALRAFADAAAYLGRDDYRQIAEANAEFIFKTLWNDNRLLHSFKDGRARFNAYLDDYANVADGLVSLYQLTFEERWLKRAETLVDHMIEQFWDADSGGFYFTSSDHEELISRTKDYFDNATPAGNSVAADVLVRLGALLGRSDLAQRAEKLFASTGALLAQYPSGFGRLLEAIDFYLGPSKEIAVVGESKDAHQFISAYRKRYLPRTVIAAGEAGRVGLLLNRPAIDGKATAYVCENMTCQRPVTGVAEFENQIA